MSDVDLNTDLELGCNGGIGKTQSTQIEWHWRKGGDLFFTVRIELPHDKTAQ